MLAYNWNSWMIFQVLLLDELTVDLDVVTRMDLLDFFAEECEQVITSHFTNYLSICMLVHSGFGYGCGELQKGG